MRDELAATKVTRGRPPNEHSRNNKYEEWCKIEKWDENLPFGVSYLMVTIIIIPNDNDNNISVDWVGLGYRGEDSGFGGSMAVFL